MNPVSSLLRLVQAAGVLAGPVLALRGKKPDAGPRLARALEKLGPAAIKLGQMLATRPDVVGADVARALEHLQDRLPPFSEAAARAEIADVFGKPVEQLFSSFGAPIAAASIAQVHRAQTADDPPVRVAVKILRPGIREQFARDLHAFALFARVAEALSAEARRLRLTAVMATLEASVALELDLRMEAAAASELYERTRGEAEFRVPHIDWSRTAQPVLTSEWIDGVSVRDGAALAAAGRDPRQVAVMVMRSFLTQALRDGFFHADMHPGNLFIDPDGRLVAVDFGIMGRLDAGMRRFMAGTLAGFLQRDYRRVAELHYEFSFVPPTHPVETFAQALRAIGEPIFGRSARDVSIARLLAQLFETTRRFDMQAQPQLVLLQKTMVVVEGVCRGLDPDFDIWEAARPVAEKWVHEQMGPEAALSKAAESLSALGKLAQDLPQLVKNAEGLSQMVAEGGMRLHPDTARAIAAEQERRARPARIVLLTLLALIAASLLFAVAHLF
ncbi:MAG: 2-polyprenylphenol 6-hydroxylase [Alphaproteobacteria bacterium]|nr:2-polyprenylphenol 6-hydroxylase [Alphaproteobacteria bacterium]